MALNQLAVILLALASVVNSECAASDGTCAGIATEADASTLLQAKSQEGQARHTQKTIQSSAHNWAGMPINEVMVFPSGMVYVFSGGDYFKWNLKDNSFGGPFKIIEDFSVPNVDAVMVAGNTAYIFSDDEFVKWNAMQHEVEEGPKPIVDDFSPFEKVDAVMVGGNKNTAYIFSDDEFVKWDAMQHEVEEGPTPIVGDFSPFEKVDAVIVGGNKNTAYIFSDDKFVKWNVMQHDLEEGPTPIQEKWSGCPFNKVDAVMVYQGMPYVLWNSPMGYPQYIAFDPINGCTEAPAQLPVP